MRQDDLDAHSLLNSESNASSTNESSAPKAEATILNFSKRAAEIREKVRKEHNLVGLNIDEDSRYARSLEQTRQDLMPKLPEFEQKYAGFVREPMFFLDQQARIYALKKFKVEEPKAYEAYARYGVYLDKDGNPDSSNDPFVTKLDYDVEQEMKQRLLAIGSQNKEPRQAIETMVGSYPEIHMQAADTVYPAFRQNYPEKTAFYNSPDLYTDQYLGKKMKVDPGARHSISLDDEASLANAIHYNHVLRILGKDAPKVTESFSDRLKSVVGNIIQKK